MTSGGVEGWLFEGGRSAAVPIVLWVDSSGFATVLDANGIALRTFPWNQTYVDRRIGNTDRRVTLPDGSAVEVHDNDAIDAFERTIGRGRVVRWVAAIERRWTVALVAIVLTVIAAAVVIEWGLPIAADFVAAFIPPPVVARLDQPVLDALGTLGVGESTLPDDRQRHISAVFERVVAAVPDGRQWKFHLVFRSSGRIGANAFALPGGTVVVTDRLIAIAKSDEQVAAVFAHEIGHIEGRHGLKRLIRNAGLGAFTLYLFGDITNLSHILASFPVLVIDAAYSRDFERAADAAAVDYLKRAELPPRALIEMLDILGRDCGMRCNGSGWLSSHPLTDERIATIQTLIDAR